MVFHAPHKKNSTRTSIRSSTYRTQRWVGDWTDLRLRTTWRWMFHVKRAPPSSAGLNTVVFSRNYASSPAQNLEAKSRPPTTPVIDRDFPEPRHTGSPRHCLGDGAPAEYAQAGTLPGRCVLAVARLAVQKRPLGVRIPVRRSISAGECLPPPCISVAGGSS